MDFLTTLSSGQLAFASNLAASKRHVVRLRQTAHEDDVAAIWLRLAELNCVDIPVGVVDDFVAAHPRVSGRDVKNVFKLASFVAARDGRPLDLATLEFALAYKPTA